MSKDYNSAKVLYLLAKDIYDKIGSTDDSAKIDEKLKAMNV